MSRAVSRPPLKLGTRRAAYNAALAALVALTGCNGDPTVAGVVVRVEVSPGRDTLAVGEVAAPFIAAAFNARDDSIPAAMIFWRSDQPFIAAVDSTTGAVRGVAPGVAAITAHAGAVSDTAQVFIVGPLALPLDTILLFPGDTITIPVEVRGGTGTPVFTSGAPDTVRVDSTTGLATALTFGSVPFTVRVDTFTVTGMVQVLDVPDTTLGNVYLSLSGARQAAFRLASRSFNHPTEDGRTAYNLNAESFEQTDQFSLLLIDSLAGPTVYDVGELPESATQTGADAVCFPPVSWGFYLDRLNVRRARSLDGSVSITTIRDVPGGRAASGRFELTLQFLDTPGDAGVLVARGTFLVPVVTLTPCPQASSPPPGPHTRPVGPVTAPVQPGR